MICLGAERFVQKQKPDAEEDMDGAERQKKGVFDGVFFPNDLPNVQNCADNAAEDRKRHIRVEEQSRNFVPGAAVGEGTDDKREHREREKRRRHRVGADLDDAQNFLPFFRKNRLPEFSAVIILQKTVWDKMEIDFSTTDKIFLYFVGLRLLQCYVCNFSAYKFDSYFIIEKSLLRISMLWGEKLFAGRYLFFNICSGVEVIGS